MQATFADLNWLQDGAGRRRLLPALFMACIVALCSGQDSYSNEADKGQVEPASGAIYFKNRYYMGGRFADVNDAPGIAWKHDSFTDPFIFDSKSITEISFRQIPGADDQGELGIELSNGDLLFGFPRDVSDGKISLETSLLGTIRFDSSLIRRVFRWSGGQSMIFSGPGPLSDWKVSGDGQGWRAEGGHLYTSKAQSSIYQDIGLTQRCRIEIEVSWEQKPNFVIAIGTDGSEASTKQAFRIEFWGSAIVMLREMGRAAKVSSLGSAEKTDGRLKLAIELDQYRQRATVYSDRGERLGEIDFRAEGGSVYPGIAFENIHGSFRLHSISVLQGAGGDADAGTLAGATVSGFENNQLILSTGTDEKLTLALDELTSLRLSPADDQSGAQNAPEHAQADPPQVDDTKDVGASPMPFHLVTHGATQLSGTLERIADGKLYMRTAYLEQTVGVPLSEVRSFRSMMKPEQGSPRTGRLGTLEMADVRMLGLLQDAAAEQGSSCLKFQPVYASNASHLLTTANGRIVYRDRELTPEQRDVRRTAQPVRRNQGGFLGAMVGALAGNENQDTSFKRHLHLRSGDTVEARVLGINEEGMLIDSLVTGEKLIPHDAIKAVELRGSDVPLNLDAAKKTRLLTVPRLRKNAPPKHLLISIDGDYLTGNVVSLDDEQAIVENRLKTVAIPRRLIARIIWFHADELSEGDLAAEQLKKSEQNQSGSGEEVKVAEVDSEKTGLRVQAIHSNGVRLTFHSDQYGGEELVGESPVLGACLVNVKSVDQLLFGTYIDASNDVLPYQQWRLTHAADPKVLSEGGEGMPSAGTSSPLVGNPAPDFQLDLLDGSSFRISTEKGKVLVLDFWATWCGPCIKAMPMIDEAVHGFDSADVKLVAVNLQESSEQIQAALNRMGLSPIVALDIDGVAAGRYQANAIPQTVVIDREGIVRNVFVGGGNGLGASLTEAIKTALEK